jgi:ATP-dependent Lon protease
MRTGIKTQKEPKNQNKTLKRNSRKVVSHKVPDELPIIPLRDIVIFPYMIYPILAGRPSTQKAVEEAVLKERLVMLLAQKNITEENPGPDDLYRIGVVGRILQVLRLPTGLVKVLIEGGVRAEIANIVVDEGVMRGTVLGVKEEEVDSMRVKAAMRRTSALFREYIVLNKSLPDELLLSLENIEEAGRLADFIAAHISFNLEKRQEILEKTNIFDRLIYITKVLNSEIEILKLEQAIDTQVKDKITRSQRNFYLQEQMRVIRKELGEEGEDDFSDIQEYSKKIKSAKMPKEARERAQEELEKLKQMAILSPEATVIRNYLDWLVSIPWYKKTEDNLDINLAMKILDEDHYGLEKPKERILEHLAVMKLAEKMKGQIICFMGPPGVGKTSLGKSIARALGRNFVRVSLGGIRDEAEIRGHRRTYIGSLPGRIIQQMKRAGTINPVFLLDEVDKIGADFRGDPSSALLEALDPEQNKNFSDHYLEVDYDLSQVMFITTANVRYSIPAPLLDRMEVIELPGYLQFQKYHIAKDFLIPKNKKEHGLKEEALSLTDNALFKIIDDYTREAGVRELDRSIAQACRKVARQIVQSGEKSVSLTLNNLEKFLGVPRYAEKEIASGETRVGSVNALAWTPDGGDILKIDVVLMKGRGNLNLTGLQGEVMKESAKASLSYIRSISDRFELSENDFLRREIHIHIPEGATPKDGPSAGVAITLAMLSALTKKPVPSTYGFTGEITLRGEILPIGGLPEKLMAANRLGLKTIFIPKKNKKDLKEVPKPVIEPLEIKMVGDFEEVLKEVFK